MLTLTGCQAITSFATRHATSQCSLWLIRGVGTLDGDLPKGCSSRGCYSRANRLSESTCCCGGRAARFDLHNALFVRVRRMHCEPATTPGFSVLRARCHSPRSRSL